MFLLLTLGPAANPLSAHVGDHPSIHDTVAAITLPMKDHFTREQLKKLTAFQVEQFLSEDEMKW